jgi:nitronate monooxygenase
MWTDTPLTKLLGIKYPILQAPMAIVTTPELAAAVANEGALGSLGASVLSPSELKQQVTSFRELTKNKAPLHVNFFVHKRPERDAAAERRAVELVTPFYRENGVEEVPAVKEAFLPFTDEILREVLDLKIEIVSFHFGLPSPEAVRALKSAGSKVLSSATNVAEAKNLEANGVDAIIAQSFEAGGHRGTFLGGTDTGTMGAMALIPQIADAVKVPVIAAGAIADARGVKAAFALGATGVQLGTAFLRSPEAHVTAPHRAALAELRDDDTRVTRAFSGRPARSLRNKYLVALAPFDHELPNFPLMNVLSKPLRAASAKANVTDCLPLWAGQSAPMAKELPAGEIVRRLVAEVEKLKI